VVNDMTDVFQCSWDVMNGPYQQTP